MGVDENSFKMMTQNQKPKLITNRSLFLLSEKFVKISILLYFNKLENDHIQHYITNK